MKIFKLSDRIKIKINEVVLVVSPLSMTQKIEVQQFLAKSAATPTDVQSSINGAKLAMKYAIKAIEGVELSDGSKYELELENNEITDECLEELLNSEIANEITLTSIGLLNGIPREIVDPTTGKPLKGVKILNPKKAKTK